MKPRPRLTTVLSLCIVLSLLLTGVAQAALPDSIASPVQSQTGEQADNTISISGSPDSSANTTARASTPQKSLAPVQPASEPLASLLPAAEAAPMQASSGGECIPVVFIPGITGSPNLPPFNSPDQPMLQALESNGYKEGETLFRFSYNWLGSNASSASSLASYVNNIKDQIERRIGVRPEHVSIIAHSMGGFVTRLYLQGHSNEVDQVFTIGSPYAGSVEMIARGTRWSNIFNGPAELLPTWQAVFDPDGNPVSDNGGYGYNPWVQANIWPSPAPDIAFYGNQFDTSHTVTRTEYQVYDPYTGISTPSYFWQRRDFIPGDETVDWQSAVTSVGSTRSVGGTHAGSVGFGSSRGVGGIVEAAAPQVVSLLTNSPNGGPENCYPYKLEITVDPESMEIPACMPVSYEVKVLNRDTEEPVDQLRDNERLEIRISGSALDDVTNESTTDPQYSGSTPSVKRPGGVTVEAKVTYLLVVPPSYVHTETMARDQASASVGLDDPPTRRDRCGRQETATFDDKTCSWKWPNGNKPCLPDDNRSVASPDLVQAAQEATVSSASIAVLANGFDQPLLDMLASLGIQADRIAPDFSPEMVGRYQVLVIPSGGLTGFAQSETMKQRLAQYAQNGGTIVAFAQEYGDQFTLLPGNALRAYGYDEDINCQANSTRIVTFAPMLLSQADELLSINVDGFFTDWSADTTVLLSRTANGMPAMLAYPYGDGWVLATTSYADMARFQGQGTADEAKLVRDLMTWALDPALQLDRYGPVDSVSIPLVATNNTMTPTTSIDLSIVDQQGTWVYASEAIPLDLAPGATGTLNTTIPMSAILAASDGQFGQWQVGVGLIDAEGVAVQSQQESYSFASSRFTDAESGHGYAGQPYALSVTSASEEYPYNSPAVFTYNVFNHSDQEQTFQVRWNMIHHSWYNVPGYNGSLNITVPAQSFATVDSLLERVVDLDRVRATLYLNNQRVAYAERGFWVVPARMTQTVTSDKTEYSWGESPVITVVTSNQAAVETPVEASLMALAPDRTTITAEAESFTLDPNGNHTFQITLPPVTAAGQYDVSVENSVYGRVALRGAARFSVAPLQARVTADLPAELTPSSSFSLNVANPGRGQLPTPTLEVSLADPTGEVLWSDQRALETLDPAQSLDESFTLSLSPITALGNYKLSYHVVSAGQTLGAGSTTLPAKLSLEATLDQASYRIRETANLAVTLRNTGRFELAPALLVSSADLGLDDTQSLVIPAGGSQSLAYQTTVPDTLLPGSYAIQVSYALGSGDSASRAPSVVILPARVLIAMDQTAVDAGDTIVVTLDNPGGVDAPVEDSLQLVDRYGRTVAQVDHADVILAGDSIQVTMDVPAGAVTGDYEFKITGTNTQTGQAFGLRRSVSVTGVSGGLEVLTSSPTYFVDEDITALASFTASGSPVDNGSLDLKICTPVWTGGTEPPPPPTLVLDSPAQSASQAAPISQDPAAKNRKLESSHAPASPQLAPDVITFTPIAGGAPLQINVANDASYQVIYGSGSTTPGQVYWTNADIADAGLFLWYDGYVIGPDFSNHPSGSASNYYDVWTPAAQGAVTGNGTPGDPWTIETNVVHQPSGASLTTRNSYVDGENYFRVDWDICLPQAAQVSTFLAADYYLQGSDNGYGLYDADTGSVGGYNYAHDWFQIFTPIRPSSHYFEGRYWEVWDNIGYAGTAGPGFNDTINTNLIDNGAGLQWDMYVNGCATVSAFWSFGETPTIPPVVPPYEETCGYVLWQTTLPLSTAGTADFNEVAGTLDTTGQLLLWGQASSATGQPFATAQYPFQVFDRDTSLTLETDRDVYRPGETVEVSGQVVNTSGITQNMVLQVTDGQGVILEESLTLDANESYSYATSVEATSDLVLVATAANATATAAPTVADPQVDASFQVPDVVGRTSFDVVLELSNTGLVPANLQAEVAGQAEPDFTLQPGETRQIYRTVLTNQDTVVVATVSGDASYDFSHPVVQGELTTLSLDVPPDPLWTGTVAVAYSLDNVGVLPADTPLDITLDGNSVLAQQVATLPGETVSGVLYLDLTPGQYQLVASTPDEQLSATLVVYALDQVDVTIDQVDAPAQLAGQGEVSVTLTNHGASPVAGTLLVQTDFDLAQAPFDLAAGETATLAVTLDSAKAPAAGSYDLVVQAWSGGTVLDETQQPLEVPEAAWLVSMPTFTLVPGTLATLPFEITNTGGAGATFTHVLDLQGLYDDMQTGWLEPGQSTTVTYTFIVPADLETRQGDGRYWINEVVTPFIYDIVGYQLDMTGSLSSQVTVEGDTVVATIEVTDLSGLGQPLPLVVRLAGVGDQQTQEIVLNGTAQVTFNLTAPGEDALISYGVYHPEGRSLLLDTMRLYVVGSPEGERPLAVYPDRDQYQPGDTVHLTAVSPVGGVLTLNAFGTPTTLLLEPGVPQSVDVILASDLLADTYQVDFVFDTGDGRVVDSAVSFEVDGDRAAIRRVVLDAAGSACAGQVGAQLKIESRYPMDGVTLTWQVTGPAGQPAGSSDNLLVDLPAGVSWWTLPPVAFASGQAGTHAVAFSLVQGTRELASGTQSFDVGDAMVLGVAVNEAYFRAGDTASADVSIQNNSTSPLTLRVLVDGQVVEERTVSQTGYVVETVDLGALDPAEHTVTAVLQGPANCVSQSTGLATVVAPPSMVIVAPSPDGNAGWYVTAPSIFLRYNDSVPAPVDGLYAWNGEANRQDNGRALSVPADGQQELAAWAVAQDGSTSTTATQTFRVDRVPPTVTANVTGSGSVEVTLAASDETSGVGSISYRLDGGDWQVYNGPLTIQVVDPITLEYMAQDVAGNESEISTLVLELVSCEIYPIALHVDTLDGVEPGTLLEDIYNGTGPGNFGWMSWNGSSSANALVASLTPPGNSDIYTNPDDPADHDLTPGDWVYGLPGVNNSRPIRSALDSLIGYPIVVPVWDSSSGQGSNLRYRLAGFARAELTGYDLPSGQISAVYQGMAVCSQ